MAEGHTNLTVALAERAGGPQMHCDEFISEIIVIGRLDRFHIEVTHDHPDPDAKVRAEVTLTFPPAVPGMREGRIGFTGHGRTMGYALRACREEIRRGVGE